MPAAEQWVRLTTPHFELFTTAGEKKGREAILYFEEVRNFFLQVSPSKNASQFPARIVAFSSEKQYRPYRIGESALAYFSPTPQRDYIVMQDINAENYPVAIHEYTHLITHHTGLNLPVWFNEGWAEVFSTLKPKGKKIMVGDIIPGRAQALYRERVIPLAVLTQVGPDSPLYNEKNKAGMFYAESWALVHMLYLSEPYRTGFSKLVAALDKGLPFDEASRSAFGKTTEEVEQDLKHYFEKRLINVVLFDAKLDKSAEEPDVSTPSQFDTDLVKADLLAAIHKNEEAARAYRDIARENPNNAEVEESLGYLAWEEGREPAARSHFAKALANNTNDAKMCYEYAQLERSSGGTKASIPAFRRALALKPDYIEARIELGVALVDDGQFADAVTELSGVKKVTPEQAPRLFSALAYACLKTGKLQEARTHAEAARKWSKSSVETERADSILKYLDQVANAEKRAKESPRPLIARTSPEKPGVHEVSIPVPSHPAEPRSRVDGKVKLIECKGNAARLHLMVNGKEMIFSIPDPRRVELKHSEESTHEFTCGPQKLFPMSVEFTGSEEKGVAGIARVLDF